MNCWDRFTVQNLQSASDRGATLAELKRFAKTTLSVDSQAKSKKAFLRDIVNQINARDAKQDDVP